MTLTYRYQRVLLAHMAELVEIANREGRTGWRLVHVHDNGSNGPNRFDCLLEKEVVVDEIHEPQRPSLQSVTIQAPPDTTAENATADNPSEILTMRGLKQLHPPSVLPKVPKTNMHRAAEHTLTVYYESDIDKLKQLVEHRGGYFCGVLEVPSWNYQDYAVSSCYLCVYQHWEPVGEDMEVLT